MHPFRIHDGKVTRPAVYFDHTCALVDLDLGAAPRPCSRFRVGSQKQAPGRNSPELSQRRKAGVLAPRRVARAPSEPAIELLTAQLAGRCRSPAVITTMRADTTGAIPALPNRCHGPPAGRQAQSPSCAKAPYFQPLPMRSSGLEPPRGNSPQGPQPRAPAQDASRSVQIVQIARVRGRMGRMGRIWKSDCCDDVATGRPPNRQMGRQKGC